MVLSLLIHGNSKIEASRTGNFKGVAFVGNSGFRGMSATAEEYLEAESAAEFEVTSTFSELNVWVPAEVTKPVCDAFGQPLPKQVWKTILLKTNSAAIAERLVILQCCISVLQKLVLDALRDEGTTWNISPDDVLHNGPVSSHSIFVPLNLMDREVLMAVDTVFWVFVVIRRVWAKLRSPHHEKLVTVTRRFIGPANRCWGRKVIIKYGTNVLKSIY